MKKQMNKQDAIRQCYLAWDEIATKKLHDKTEEMYMNYTDGCPCCQYVVDNNVSNNRNCDACPLLPIWGEQPKFGYNTLLCVDGTGSLYAKWRKANKLGGDSSKHARAIANFCKKLYKSLYGADVTKKKY